MKKVCCVLGSRANYSSIKSALIEIKKNPDLKLQIILTASSILQKYGSIESLLKKDGLKIDLIIPTLLVGETPLTMAKSTGLGLIELSSAFNQLKSEIVIVVGDRFETMATTLAAAYNNIAIAHTMGGEVSGTIDESIRHAITKFAHLHFPANLDAKKRIIKMGEDPKTVYNTGCPRIDTVKDILNNKKLINLNSLNQLGVGEKINFKKDFLILSQHPVTTEYGDSLEQISITLEAINKLNVQTLVLWPNPDAGSEDIAKGIRKFREKKLFLNMRFFKNLPLDTYIHLLNKTKCLIGNSSSGIREGSFIGTPVVNIGTRQNKRVRGKNIIDVGHDIEQITEAIIKQLKHGNYLSEKIYGDGKSGIRIAKILSKAKITIQKNIYY